jgi:hypothetical protein
MIAFWRRQGLEGRVQLNSSLESPISSMRLVDGAAELMQPHNVHAAPDIGKSRSKLLESISSRCFVLALVDHLSTIMGSSCCSTLYQLLEGIDEPRTENDKNPIV